MSARGAGRRRAGALARRIGLVIGLVTLGSAALTAVLVHYTMSQAIPAAHGEVASRGLLIGLALAAICAVIVGLVAYSQGSQVASRLTELGLGVAKIGRGSSEVRLRYQGDDEVAALGRALQYLASDLSAMAKEMEQGGGLGASMDPMVRDVRDRALPRNVPRIEGFELDGAVAPGSRGGMEYFGWAETEAGVVMFLVSPEGSGAIAAIAARMARDELARALGAKASARKALAHTNRVLHRQLPKGACAKACVLAVEGAEVKLYQAGFRAPLLICSAGRLGELEAEGLALGLDEGPVFEKALRSVLVPATSGTRLVMTTEAALRLEELEGLIVEHSAKHTAAFMNLVLGALESGSGEGGLREDVVLLTAKRWT